MTLFDGGVGRKEGEVEENIPLYPLEANIAAFILL